MLSSFNTFTQCVCTSMCMCMLEMVCQARRRTLPSPPHPAPAYSRTTLDEPALGFALDAPLIEGHSADVRRQGALHFARGVGNEGRGGGQRDPTLCKSLR